MRMPVAYTFRTSVVYFRTRRSVSFSSQGKTLVKSHSDIWTDIFYVVLTLVTLLIAGGFIFLLTLVITDYGL